MDVKEMLKSAAGELKKHAPNIFTGLSVIGAISAVVMAIKATPKALEQIEEAKHLKKDDILRDKKDISEEELEIASKLKPSDYFFACWKTYTPTALMLVTCITSAVSANIIMEKRQGILAGALGISQETLREYQKRVIEEVGPKKEQKIRDDVAKRSVKEEYSGAYNPYANPGEQLFYDGYSGRYFISSMPKVKMAEAKFNNLINDDMFACINRFYDYINCKELKHIASGELGYHIGSMLNINYVGAIKEDTGAAYIILDYGENVKPYR